jgi:phosphate transport system substrate-binding protein
MIQRICTNYGKCVLADNHEDFALEQEVMTYCPLCDGMLSEVKTPSVSEVRTPSYNEVKAPAVKEVKTPSVKRTNSIFADVAFAVFYILLLGIAVGKDWIKAPQGTDAAELKMIHQNSILRLAGSEIVGDNLGPALAEAFLKSQGATNLQILPGTNPEEKIVAGFLPGDAAPSSIEIDAHGTATAFTSLAEETCDIGMASRRIKPEEAAKLATLGNMTSAGSEHILGLDGIAVIVNPSNRLGELRKDEIRRIFTGDITDWSQVGSSRGEIKIYARDDQSGAFETFKSLVLNGKPLAPSARRFEDSNALSEAVSGDPNGIGFISFPYIHNAKSIAVSEKGTDALKPTRLTIATEDYPLSRRLYLYTPATARNKYMQMFVEFALSKQGQEVVAASGFVSQNVQRAAQAVSDAAPEEYKLLTEGAERLSLDFRLQDGASAQDNKVQLDLDRIASMIADQGGQGSRILLFGFADNAGTPEESQMLSLNQAKIVESQLIQRGIKPAVVRGFGSELPIASNDSIEGRKMNRRVEIWMKKS